MFLLAPDGQLPLAALAVRRAVPALGMLLCTLAVLTVEPDHVRRRMEPEDVGPVRAAAPLASASC